MVAHGCHLRWWQEDLKFEVTLGYTGDWEKDAVTEAEGPAEAHYALTSSDRLRAATRLAWCRRASQSPSWKLKEVP